MILKIAQLPVWLLFSRDFHKDFWNANTHQWGTSQRQKWQKIRKLS